MKVKAIFFDIDNTLYDSRAFAAQARRNSINAMREAGLKATEKEAYSALMTVIGKRTSNYDYHFNDMLKLLGAKTTPRMIAAGIAAYHNTKASILPFPEVTRVVLSLRDSGYKIYIASEGESLKQWDKLIRLGLDMLFHDVFVTEEVGKKKSKDFYKTILKKLGLAAGEAVMVGDSEEKDILPAKEAGMRTVLVSHDGKKKGKADYEVRDLTGLQAVTRGLG